MDSFLEEGIIPSDSIGSEILARRLAGINIMNESKVKNPSAVADQLEYCEEDTMLPHRVLTAAIKTSALFERITGNNEGKANKFTGNKKKSNNIRTNGKGTGLRHQVLLVPLINVIIIREWDLSSTGHWTT
jgi:hypothetical protein